MEVPCLRVQPSIKPAVIFLQSPSQKEEVPCRIILVRPSSAKGIYLVSFCYLSFNLYSKKLTWWIFLAATPKSSRSSQRKSHPRISKKKLSKGEKAGSVYKPPSNNLPSTCGSAALIQHSEETSNSAIGKSGTKVSESSVQCKTHNQSKLVVLIPLYPRPTKAGSFQSKKELRTESPALAPAIDHTSTNSEFCLNEDGNASIQSAAATTSETPTKVSFSGPVSELRSESVASSPSSSIELPLLKSTATIKKALKSAPLQNGQSEFLPLDLTSTSNSHFSRKSKLKKRKKNDPPCRHLYSTGLSTATPSQSSAADQSSFYSPSQFSAVNYSICNIQPEPPTSYSARVSAERNQRSALPESPKSFKRRKGLISSKFFVTSLANVILENLTNFIFPAATSKTSRPSRRKSRPRISKKKNKDSNELGFVYNPPSQHSYSTRLSTATPLQSSAANQSSCYSPSQSSAINHSIHNIQSEPPISYSAEVSFSAERNQICGYPSCSSSSRQMQSFYSTPITSLANSSIDRQRQNIFHKNLKTSKRLRRNQKGNFQGSNESFVSQWQASVCPKDLESGSMSFLPSHSCSGKKIASEMLKGINCIAQGINFLQMYLNQGQSKGKMKVTGEGRNNTLLAQVRQNVATLFGKDLDMKKQIFWAPATKSERRLWRNDLRNDLDDDELSQSDEDIEGQDPSFPYPGGPATLIWKCAWKKKFIKRLSIMSSISEDVLMRQKIGPTVIKRKEIRGEDVPQGDPM
ncbi:hypothetical protein PPACK8108_LOCUS6548 [Phakopsora pachyrhizi]|uniref:Uncharacterized protein n=1 Tax=Phakopsora pachyrhizi TaxID=170000 RepID=A0AAV0ARB2_PHAPC|nr:hypothetical protein PPACK8108_LOCUS6548 [Phakopsora pachyrhizi]